MSSFQPIILNKPVQAEVEVVKVLDIKMEDYMHDARKLLQEAGDNVEHQTEAIIEIVNHLLTYDNHVKMMRYVDILAKEFKIKKGDFSLAIKEAQSAQKEAETTGEGETSPLISRVEQYIRKRWNIYFNIISNEFMYKEHDQKEFQIMNEHNLYRELQKAHLKYSMSDLKSLLKSDFVEKRNVFVEYFEHLEPWDGDDHIAKLSTYIHVQNTKRGGNEHDRFERMFKKMFVRSVACSLEADFNKQCFTFVHERQNSGKSTFMRWLVPPQLENYYTENIGTSKDDLIALTENFIVNIDELSTLSKYDINALKSVMSKHRVKVRLPYGERPELLQRRCNFVASTNRLEFLNDETGSVRWVCFLLDRLDWDYKKEVDINKVWAQAYHLFKETNFDYQLTPAEIEENEQANKTFLIRSPEMELIQRYMVPATKEDYETWQLKKTGPEVFFKTSTDILTELNAKSSASLKLSSVNVGKSLKILGFVQQSQYQSEAGISKKGYYLTYAEENANSNTWKEPDSFTEAAPKKDNSLPF